MARRITSPYLSSHPTSRLALQLAHTPLLLCAMLSKRDAENRREHRLVDVGSDPVPKVVVQRQCNHGKKDRVDNYFSAIAFQNGQGFSGNTLADISAAIPTTPQKHKEEAQNIGEEIAIQENPRRGCSAGQQIGKEMTDWEVYQSVVAEGEGREYQT